MNEEAPKTSSSLSSLKDHMANERTFLAWIRTSIGIMAFGFVVEKFALIIKQMTYFLGKSHMPIPSSTFAGYSSYFGVFLVAIGLLMCLLAFVKYKKVENQIKSDTYYPTIFLDVMLTVSVLLIGVFLMIYLKSNI